MTEAKDEWVVYRLKSGKVNAVPRHKWNSWSLHTKETVGAVVVAEGLKEPQALQFVALTKET